MQKYLLATATLVSCLAAGTALASHGKAGLWSVSVTMSGMGANLPDMSKMPPEAAARMKAMGLSMSGNTMTSQHCMTAEEVANDAPAYRGDPSCKMSNIAHHGGAMSADVTCSGEFKGTGHVQFNYDSDTHYTGQTQMRGTMNGKPFSQDQSFEGRWLSPSCGAVKN